MIRNIVLLGAAFLIAQPAVAQTAKTGQAPISSSSAAGKRALDNPDVVTVRNVTRAELVAGLIITDPSGNQIGTISQLAVNDVILIQGNTAYRLPITAVYAYMKDGVDHFASRLARASLPTEKVDVAAMRAPTPN